MRISEGGAEHKTFYASPATCLEWLACDEDGSVAWFETGSCAPIPESVCSSDRDRGEAIQLAKQLEPFTISVRYPDLLTKEKGASPGDIQNSLCGDLFDFFASFSIRGLYAYEPVEDPARAPYERATAPRTPVHLDQLPSRLRLIVAQTKLPCRFSECQQVTPRITNTAKPFEPSRRQRTAKRPPKSKRPARLSYEDSCRLLLKLGFLHRIDYGDTSGKLLPTLPDRRPQPDDDLPFGVQFFWTWVGNGAPFGLQSSDPDFEWDKEHHHLENLTLQRTFFGRSEVSSISFQNTDLSESTFCWNDFIEVDFTDADLLGSDLRAARFVRTMFVRANLRNVDLRRSNFEECGFAGAEMSGAKLTRKQGKTLPLSEKQKQAINWQRSEGEESPGG